MTWIQIQLVDDSPYNMADALVRIAAQIAEGNMDGVNEVRTIDETSGEMLPWKGWE